MIQLVAWAKDRGTKLLLRVQRLDFPILGKVFTPSLLQISPFQ